MATGFWSRPWSPDDLLRDQNLRPTVTDGFWSRPWSPDDRLRDQNRLGATDQAGGPTT